MRIISLFVFLMVFWLLLSGHYSAFLIGLGVLSAGLCILIAYRMKIIDSEGHPAHLLVRVPIYFPWLMWEILKSTIDVVKIILHPKLPISPRVFHLKAEQKTSVGVNVFANSITLTPGTFTVKIKDDDLLIHALTEDGAKSLQTGEMPLNKKVVEFENA